MPKATVGHGLTGEHMQRPKTPAAILAVFVSASLVAGCAQQGPYGDQQFGIGRTGGGAALGAIGGAALGALSGKGAVDRRQKALIGAGIGALAGGGIGYYMNQQEQQLREQLANSPVQVQRVQDTIVLTVPSGVTFDTNSATLLPAAQNALNDVARVLASNQQTTIDVVGHTDSTGEDAYNLGLSERRAQAVAGYLSTQGVQQQRILWAGRGETNPVATNDTEQGRAMNRRVEIRINPLAQPTA
jgi:outer membrane protein OmpA-like peptidoglycan-associated protein